MVQTCILIWLGLITKILFRSHSTLRLPLRNRTLIPRYPSKPPWASMPRLTVDRAHLRRTRRRRMAVRSAQSYSESPEERPEPFGFGLIKAPLTCVRGFVACISSRITAVIQVTETIQCIRCDLMSHSRFHLNSACTAHAWLNL